MALFNVKKREFAHLHPPPILLLPSARSLEEYHVPRFLSSVEGEEMNEVGEISAIAARKIDFMMAWKSIKKYLNI